MKELKISDQASWLSHVVMGVEEQHQEVSGLLGVCLSGTGALKESELSHIFLSKELVTFNLYF